MYFEMDLERFDLQLLEEFIALVNSKPWRMDGLVKTCKVNNPVGVITNGCNTATKNLSVL